MLWTSTGTGNRRKFTADTFVTHVRTLKRKLSFIYDECLPEIINLLMS